ncbi:hypothetical protein E0500_028475 [Streptomyces sp. KM273126]|uniref:hypothetical protein n=1 Tax=Streptomyces sp. KM273126 TaxID=2545247 RepID=UPI00103DB511|nr:hypothetical protein [Streptomyces sp. KM273126]MBA2811231.1 hypothetical protein [Streptomyces sp. KM273126]
MTANGWESALGGVPTGVALVGGDGTIQWVNQGGHPGRHPRGGERRQGYFRLEDGAEPDERICTWSADPKAPRWLACTQGARVRLGADGTRVGFRDVTAQRQQHRHTAALTRAAANMASNSSLEEVPSSTC